LLSASVLYGALFLLKGLIIGLRRQRSGWWVPLFLICVAVTCVLPVVIAYPVFNYLTRHTPALSWMLDIAFAYFGSEPAIAFFLKIVRVAVSTYFRLMYEYRFRAECRVDVKYS